MRQRRSIANKILVIVVSTVFLCAPLANAQAQTAAADSAVMVNGKAVSTGTRGVRISKPGTIEEAHFKNTDLRSVLQMLSMQSKQNIVATKSVTGTVTADFYNVTFDDALAAILRANDFVYDRRGDFIFVYTRDEYEEVKKNEAMIDKVIHLKYLTSADASSLVTDLLSAGGTISQSPASGTGIGSSDEDAGGDSFSLPDVIVVRDTVEVIKRIEAVLSELDIKPPQILIECVMLRADLTEDNDLGIDISDFSNIIPGMDMSVTVDTSTTGTVPAGGLTMNVTTNDAGFLIRALETVTDVTVVANPKLLVVNKQRGEFMVGNRDGYLTTLVTETSAVETVKFLETGTRLVVRPWVCNKNEIRMELHPENSTGQVAMVGSSALPSESTTEVTSNVIVKDGHTIIIGGLFRESTTLGRSQIPIAGNLPVIGTLFRSTSDAIHREEVIILITPHIIKDTPDLAVSEQLKTDIERIRMGARQGLQWWGRGKLAQTHMKWAKSELAKGRNNLALWNVKMALSLEPSMMDAIRLKERLDCKAIWADQSDTSAVRYTIERMIMQDIGKPYKLVVPPDRPMDNQKMLPEVRKRLGVEKRYQMPLSPIYPPAAPIETPINLPAKKDETDDETGSTKKD